MQVVAFADIGGVTVDADFHIEVTGRSACRSRFALSGELDPRTRGNAGRYLDGERPAAPDAALPVALIAGSLMTVPKPSQEPHGAVVMTAQMDRTARWTWPLPPQMSQRSGCVPGRQQLPSHVGQTTAVSTSSFLLTPNTASLRSMRTLISASAPAHARGRTSVPAATAKEGIEDVTEREATAGVAATEAVVSAVLVTGGIVDATLLGSDSTS